LNDGRRWWERRGVQIALLLAAGAVSLIHTWRNLTGAP
jgi:hypothetical protein